MDLSVSTAPNHCPIERETHCPAMVFAYQLIKNKKFFLLPATACARFLAIKELPIRPQSSLAFSLEAKQPCQLSLKKKKDKSASNDIYSFS